MTVKLSFHGAARTVTGSCYLLEAGGRRMLVDCGMFQGTKTIRELNYRDFPFDPRRIDAMLLTHAHIDHSGLIPKLVKHGYAGKIHCTGPTVELCGVMLPDSGYIQEMEVRQLNERNRKRDREEVVPIYTRADAERALENFSAVSYEAWFEPLPGIRARYWNAGHLLGSASIEVELAKEGGKPLRILFSGDIGPAHKLLQPDPEAPRGFDIVICESTYGGRDRFERSEEARRKILALEVNKAAARRGALLIPSFAVERTQEIVTDLVMLMDEGHVPRADIFIDSPLASRATGIFTRHASLMENGKALDRAFRAPFVHATESVEESKALARFSGFRIIVAASGMCEAGRIRHHLKNHLWQASTTVLLAGFQAEGTLGRILENGAERVTIMGETIAVKAAIRRIEDYSGHADGPELVAWLRERMPVARSVFLTHGEEEAQLALERDIKGVGIPGDCIFRPRLDDVYDLSGEACAFLAEETRPRTDPDLLGMSDQNQDFASLMLDIEAALDRQADAKSRGVLIRRLRRALEGEGAPHPAGQRRDFSRRGR